MSRYVIDSHLHVWDLSAGGYSWLTPAQGPLHRSFLVNEAVAELENAGVACAVLVQAEDSTRDTQYLLDVAAGTALVAGVVGWVQLDDTAVADKALGALAEQPHLVGIRHLVHDDPRDTFLALSEVRESLALLVERGLPFDVPNAWPRHLHAVADLADALPRLTVVVDHLGKPPRGTDQIHEWETELRKAAERPNTVAKLSGLQVDGQPYTVEALRPVLEVALEAFGASRLMYGGDWPMTVSSGGYAHTWSILSALVGELTAAEQDQILHATAGSVYGLDGRP